MSPQQPGVPDHAAPETGVDARNRAIRTFVQGLAATVLLAVVLVVQDALADAGHGIDWSKLWTAVAVAALTSGASYVGRFVKPPA